MRTLIHVSDLHFGRSDESLMAALIGTWSALNPDLVVISGDLTQRAEPAEFEAARSFLTALTSAGMKYVVVPGNHDIAPLSRPVERIRAGFKNYRAYISEHTEQFYFDGEVAIACLNTVRRLQPVNGHIRKDQLLRARDWFERHSEALKIVVTHHPLRSNPKRIGRLACVRGSHAHKTLSGLDVDMFLSGHYHRAHVERPHALDVHAGTVSQRIVREPASFNIIEIDTERIAIHTHYWVEQETHFEHKTTVNVPRKKHKLPTRARIGKRLVHLRDAVRGK